MPRRAAPGDRASVERALPDELHRALAALCALFDVPFGPPAEGVLGWQGTPLQVLFETAAVVARARKFIGAGESELRAHERAAAELGVPWETVRSRLLRWHQTARRRLEMESRYAHGQPADAA